jgi:hypothetical protein
MYRMKDFVAEFGRSRNQIHNWIDRYADFVEIVGSGHDTRYTESTRDVLRIVSQMSAERKSTAEITAVLRDDAGDSSIEQRLEKAIREVITEVLSGQQRLVIDVNIRFAR